MSGSWGFLLPWFWDQRAWPERRDAWSAGIRSSGFRTSRGQRRGFRPGGTGRATRCPDRANRGGAMNRPFLDRHEAGRVLAERLQKFAGRPDVIVLGLPRGGVPVAYEVARALGVPFDVFLVRKLGAPGQEELAMGAIASGGVVVINHEVVDGLRIPWESVEDEIARERMELTRREVLYRGDRAPLERLGPDRDPGRRRPGHRLDHAGRRASREAEGAGRASWSPSPPRRRRPARNSRPSPMSASARSRRNRSGPSASGIRTSSRPATRR